MIPRIGQPAPDFCLESHTGEKVCLSDYRGKKNVVLAFFPLAWTPIGTSQIPSYQVVLNRFDGVQTQVLGLSVDSVHDLKAWADSLGGITYPLLSDSRFAYPHGDVVQRYGILRQEGYAERAIFIIDKQGIICYVDIHDIDTQPDNDVLFRELKKLEPEATVVREPDQPVLTPEPTTDVVLYCTSWCPDCRRARAYLKEHAIKYVEVDITRDRVAAARLRGWANGNETTPTFDIGGEVIVSFNIAKLNKVLGIK